VSASAAAAAASGGLEWQLFHLHLLSHLTEVMLYLIAHKSKNVFLMFMKSKHSKDALNIKIKYINLSTMQKLSCDLCG